MKSSCVYWLLLGSSAAWETSIQGFDFRPHRCGSRRQPPRSLAELSESLLVSAAQGGWRAVFPTLSHGIRVRLHSCSPLESCSPLRRSLLELQKWKHEQGTTLKQKQLLGAPKSSTENPKSQTRILHRNPRALLPGFFVPQPPHCPKRFS